MTLKNSVLLNSPWCKSEINKSVDEGDCKWLISWTAILEQKAVSEVELLPPQAVKGTGSPVP
jgi:hypothetical protein